MTALSLTASSVISFRGKQMGVDKTRTNLEPAPGSALSQWSSRFLSWKMPVVTAVMTALFFVLHYSFRLHRHCSQPLIPPVLPSGTSKAHYVLQPCCQRSTRGDARSLVGYLLKETSYNCQATLVVFSDACSDSRYTGYNPLCLLLVTLLAKSWSECPLWRADHHYMPSSIHVDSDIKGLDQNFLGQGRSPWGHGMKEDRSCGHFLNVLLCTDLMDENDDALGFLFVLKLLHHWQGCSLYIIFIPETTRPRNYSICSVDQLIRATPSKMHP